MSKLTKVSKTALSELDAWIEGIGKNRIEAAGSSVSEFKFAKCRVRQLKGPNYFPELGGCSTEDSKNPDVGSVVYWMIRDQRVQGNINHPFRFPFILRTSLCN
ncbi:unnamed protein product [Echinostoma caproni]|uniref:Transposase n=1 Tax=Echinostoma caproni TaxID=27848 RepID=A0A183B5T8_9TREM|nr:unnamed protein product [Echinostoma caproni]